MTEKEQNTYPKWIHPGLIERAAANHKKDVGKGISDENEPFSLREVGNALNETVDIFIELLKEEEQLREENESLKQENKKLKNFLKELEESDGKIYTRNGLAYKKNAWQKTGGEWRK